MEVDALVDAAAPHFLSRQPYRHVRLPETVRLAREKTVEVDAIFTTDGARPRWNNLGLVVHRLRDDDSLKLWRDRIEADLPAAGVLISENDNAYLVLPTARGPAEVVSLPGFERLPGELAKYAPRFAPLSLAQYRVGQLSFADTALRIRPGTLEFASRHRTALHEALRTAISGALGAVPALRTELREPVFRFALAYLSARVLEDKGFFEGASLSTDPGKLLKQTVAKTNGFLKKAYQEALPRLEAHPGVLTALAANLGPATTFALIDHHDVGRLYEDLIDALRSGEIDGAGPQVTDVAGLQQHYTPMALTEQILAHLPLERIRPADRYVFDPTAGSGSFLLAATQRLAAMTDLPDDPEECRTYLEQHVVGNDTDPNVADVASLRYRLLRESELAADRLPRPARFLKQRYQDLTLQNLGFKPTVVVANPPYAEQGGEQEAARFVHHALTWLTDGAQFAFVLPQTFLIQSSHSMGEARRELSRRSRILEVWQLPEGVVGMSALQPVCVILGIVGGERCTASIARAVFSRADVRRVRVEGLLGASWLSALDGKDGNWRDALTPPVHVTGIPLSEVFHVFCGPTPNKEVKATADRDPGDTNAGPYFSFSFVGDRVWADPERRPKALRWMTDWRFDARKNREFLTGPKVVVSRSTHRGAQRPFRVCYDDSGHFPNNDHHCIAAHALEGPHAPEGIDALSAEDRLLWLTGILTSSLAILLVLARRSDRHAGKDAWLDLPLPPKVDPDIVRLVRDMIVKEKADPNATPLAQHRDELEVLVKRSYGNPSLVEIPRTGVDGFNDQLAAARKEPSTRIVGQVVDFAHRGGRDQILLSIDGMSSDQEAWVPLPHELPGWALDGTPFVAATPQRARDHGGLRDRAALHDFEHSPRAYSSFEELEEQLRGLVREKS